MKAKVNLTKKSNFVMMCAEVSAMYFDTHVHLNSEQLNENIELYIQNALNQKVQYMVCVGYDLASSQKAVKIASQYDFIYAAVGIGPNDCANTTQADLEIIEQLLTHEKVVALGEVGLDYYWDEVSSHKQKEIFKKQIELAKKYHKPLIIHARDAMNDTYEMLKAGQHYGIMHCYSGSYEMAKRFIDIGFYISLAGPVTFKNAKVPKEVAKNIDINKLLIETDCPYLTPHPYRGKLNEPANVVYIAKEIAFQKDMSVEEVARITTFNAKNVFGIK